MSYVAPEQSPHWDDVMSLAQMLAEAQFFILRKRQPHGDLVDVVVSKTAHIGEVGWYHIRALNHDAAGVTCVAEGSISLGPLTKEIAQGLAELTTDPAVVLRHIWEVMTCHANADKLFTEYSNAFLNVSTTS